MVRKRNGPVEKDEDGVGLGKKSAEKRFEGKSKKEISEMMRALRARRLDKRLSPPSSAE